MANLDREGLSVAVDRMLNSIKLMRESYFAANYPNLKAERVTAALGSRYVKLVVMNYDDTKVASVFGFIDRATGNVLKAASFNAPAKGVRGNVFDADNGMGAVGPYSVGGKIRK